MHNWWEDRIRAKYWEKMCLKFLDRKTKVTFIIYTYNFYSSRRQTHNNNNKWKKLANDNLCRPIYYDNICHGCCFNFVSSMFAVLVKVLHNWFSEATNRFKKFNFLRFSRLKVDERLKADWQSAIISFEKVSKIFAYILNNAKSKDFVSVVLTGQASRAYKKLANILL